MTNPKLDVDDDVTWIRSALQDADPAVLSAAPPAPDPRWLASATLDRDRMRRRATAVTSVAAAAALIVGVVSAAVIGRQPGRSSFTVSSNVAAATAAYSSTVSAHSAHLDLALTVGGTALVAASGVGDLATGDSDLNLNLPAPLGQVEVIDIGRTAYVRVPQAFSSIAGGKPWLKLDSSMLLHMAGGAVGVPALESALDVTGLLQWLRAVGQVTPAGPGTSHGEPTANYNAVVDLAKVAALAPANARAKAQQLAGEAGQSVPVSIALDRSGRLRHLAVSFDTTKMHLPAGDTIPRQATGVASLTLDLWDFGTPVHVTAPPAGQVSDGGGLMSHAGDPGSAFGSA